MEIELANIQKKLDCILNEETLSSEKVLSLSKELDNAIKLYFQELNGPL